MNNLIMSNICLFVFVCLDMITPLPNKLIPPTHTHTYIRPVSYNVGSPELQAS